MIERPGAQLSEQAQTTCEQCQTPVWVYVTPVGDYVTLDDRPGEYLIDRHNKTYRSMRSDGYSAHDCSSVSTRAPLVADPTSSEFLWA